MFSVNDEVLYLNQGVCRISEISNIKFGRETKRYYVLKPVFQKESVVYVPVDNEKLTGKMKKVLTKQQIKELIREIPDEQPEWIDNESERHEKFREIVSGGDRKQLVRLIRSLYNHRCDQQLKGKKLHQGDERIFKEAERLLYDEFALVLNIKPDEVVDFISLKLKAE